VVSLIRTEAVVRAMGQVAKDGTWGMVTNFIWMSVHHSQQLIPLLTMISLVELWLGITCTCLPTLHTFVKRQWAARCAKINANKRGDGMPEHQWIGLEETPEKPSSGAKSIPVVKILDSKSHGSDSSMARTIVCEEDSLPPASQSKTRSTTFSAV
jgi:hypothetical protein